MLNVGNLLVRLTTVSFLFALVLSTFAEEPKAESPASHSGEVKKTEWVELFDGKSMAGWKVTEFGTGGEITVEKGQLELGYGDGCTGVTWTKDFPKSDFEVQVQAMRVDGTDFFCGMTFPVGESPCSLIVGGWGGAVVGLSSIDGEDASQNKTCRFMTFQKKQWYDIRVRVTKSQIVVWIDNKQVVNQGIAGHKFTIRPEVNLSRPFGLCSWCTTAAIKKVQLRSLTGEEAAKQIPDTIAADDAKAEAEAEKNKAEKSKESPKN